MSRDDSRPRRIVLGPAARPPAEPATPDPVTPVPDAAPVGGGPTTPAERASLAADEGPWRALLGLAMGIALVRFWRLGAWGLWVDEAFTLHDVRHMDAGEIPAYPLHYWLTSLWIGDAGEPSEAMLRFLPAVFGWLGPLLAFWAFRPAIGRTRAAGVALLLALSSWHVYWSQSARAYTLAQDVSLLGAGLYLRGLAAPSLPRTVLGLAVGALAAAAHPSAALLLPAWLIAPWLANLLRSPLIHPPPVLLPVVFGVGTVLVFGRWGLGVWHAYESAKAVDSLGHFVLTTGYYITPTLALGAMLGAALGVLRRSPFDAIATWTCLIVATIGAVASTAVRVTAQYVFVLQPWVCLLATGAIVDAAGRLRRGRWPAVYAGLLVLPAVVDLGLYFTVRHGDRERWKEAYAWVRAHEEPEDLILGMAAPVGEHYLVPGKEDLRSHSALVRLNPFTSFLPIKWARYGRRTWFVLKDEDLQGWPAKDRAAFRAFLAAECTRAATFPVPATARDLTVHVYLRDPDRVPRDP